MQYMCMKFSVLSFSFADVEPDMSFGSGSDCPEASQMCGKNKRWFGVSSLSPLIPLNVRTKRQQVCLTVQLYVFVKK